MAHGACERRVLAAGALRPQIEDALAVCFSFNVTGRSESDFGFFVPASSIVLWISNR